MDDSFDGLNQRLNAAIEYVKQKINDILLILVVPKKD